QYLGSHDFTSFCTQDKREIGSFTRTITQAEVRREGDFVYFFVAAVGFLYKLVRILTGSLLYVAQGKITPQDIPSIFAARDRSKAGPTAPPQGLYLNRVDYEEADLHA
ncbi:MAG: tRNA pseudouridine(38-40) synthase TruA, partial [Oscillospiraceae bacterium]|nr:tRNA pseudouridine(38-40) synthase TruA [Oscillospiraceae bacterium]